MAPNTSDKDKSAAISRPLNAMEGKAAISTAT